MLGCAAFLVLLLLLLLHPLTVCAGCCCLQAGAAEVTAGTGATTAADTFLTSTEPAKKGRFPWILEGVHEAVTDCKQVSCNLSGCLCGTQRKRAGWTPVAIPYSLPVLPAEPAFLFPPCLVELWQQGSTACGLHELLNN